MPRRMPHDSLRCFQASANSKQGLDSLSNELQKCRTELDKALKRASQVIPSKRMSNRAPSELFRERPSLIDRLLRCRRRAGRRKRRTSSRRQNSSTLKQLQVSRNQFAPICFRLDEQVLTRALRLRAEAEVYGVSFRATKREHANLKEKAERLQAELARTDEQLRDMRTQVSHSAIELVRSESERRRLGSEIDHLSGLVESYRRGGTRIREN